ncbi:uncharacterized protein BJ212DRAFT_1399844 [Suillus subaureus]|uniref:Uncharacterized protein n=1 Tax=Suillus subaureus TaxID=48587 RepID=A0A9P7J3N5_9AGAM|nr:uncharacterized protein BJ212DRAFT_1399844 [Suillus subaureus]KAG1801088.1 hypothetical protein BJ212DRAFT_1399844 [Suillus subaureus]
MLILMLLDCWTYYQRSRWKGQVGHLNYRIAQFQRLREGLYSGHLHYRRTVAKKCQNDSCQKPLEGGGELKTRR